MHMAERKEKNRLDLLCNAVCIADTSTPAIEGHLLEESDRRFLLICVSMVLNRSKFRL